MLLELWFAALRSETGIAIPTDNRSLLRQHLYRARAEANKPELDDLVILLPDIEGELWLVHKDADSPGTDNQGYPKLVHP